MHSSSKAKHDKSQIQNWHTKIRKKIFLSNNETFLIYLSIYIIILSIHFLYKQIICKKKNVNMIDLFKRRTRKKLKMRNILVFCIYHCNIPLTKNLNIHIQKYLYYESVKFHSYFQIFSVFYIHEILLENRLKLIYYIKNNLNSN